MIVVYGATGYTGRLISAELARLGVPFVAAGRDRGKLEALARSLPSPPEIAVAALDDPTALQHAAARGRVLLDCAGPFLRWGRPVLDAALAAGAHFLDITGELGWMREAHARDTEARARGVAVVNAVGFDVVPTDAAAVLAAEAAGAPVERVRIAFASVGGGASQGTTRSAVDRAHEGGRAWVDGELQREPIGRERWEVPFPPPVGARQAVSIPWGDLATAPRSTGAREVRTFMALPRRLTRWLPLIRPLTRLMALGPVRGLAERWVCSLPEGPSAEQRRRSRFAVYAEASGARGTRAAWVTGPDTYDFTAASAARCAMWADEEGFAARGALTPAQAFGARRLLEALAGSDVRFGVVEG